MQESRHAVDREIAPAAAGHSLRVLVVTGQFPSAAFPNRATFNRQHLGALAREHAVEIVCPVPWTERRRIGWRRALALPPALSPIPVTYPTYWYPPGTLRSTYGACLRASMGARFRARALAFRPDLLLAVWAYPEGEAAVALGRELGLPVAIQVLGSDINLLDSFPGRRQATFRALGAADLVLPVSQALRQAVIDGGVPAERTRVVYRGVDRELFRPLDPAASREALGLAPGRRVLLFAGNLVPVKALDVLLRAFATATWTEPVDLHLLGDGPLRPRLVALARELGIAGNVHFHGVVDHASLPTWYAAADLVVLPSLAEGVPNVLLEARACGRPYVATAVGGIPEISEHSLARLVPPGDSAALATALEGHLAAAPDATSVEAWQSWESAGASLAEALASIVRGENG